MRTSRETTGRSRPGRPRRRNGFTLIETLTAVSIVSIVLGLCAVSIQLMFRLANDGRARTSAASSLGRLARQLRADAHACDGVRKLDRSRVELEMGGGRAVVYKAGVESVTREGPAAGKLVHHESFAIGKGKSAAFARRDDGPRSFLVLTVGRAALSGPNQSPGLAPPSRPIEVWALIGKDHRAMAGGPNP